MSTTISVVSSSSSVIVSSKINWKINNFSKLNAQVGTCSDLFSVGDYKWKLRIYPKGEGKVYDHLSLFIFSVDSTKSVDTAVSFAVTSQTHPNHTVRKEARHKFPENCILGRGWHKFMSLNEFHNPAKGYLVNDTCLITVEVTCTLKEEKSNGDGGAVVESEPADKVPELKRQKNQSSSDYDLNAEIINRLLKG